MVRVSSVKVAAPMGLAQEMMAKMDMAGCKMQMDKAMGMMK